MNNPESVGSVIASGFFNLLGVLLGAFLVIGNEWLRERRSRKNDLSFLAVVVVAGLDRFVSQCIDVGYDDGLEYVAPHHFETRHPSTPTPKFSPQGLDVNWRVISGVKLHEIFGIEVRVAAIENYLRDFAELDFHDFAETTKRRRQLYTELGLSVAQIASDLRRLAGLPPQTEDAISGAAQADVLVKLQEAIGKFSP